MRKLYTFLFYLVLPFIFLRLLWRSRNAPLKRSRWSERLGFYSFGLEQCIWIHAVSLGETIAAIPMIKALKTKYPHSLLLVTNMTETGAARVKAVFGESIYNAYIPYDLPDAWGRFFNKITPQVLIVMETELWPNLFATCRQRNIPVVVTNARLSEKSAKRYSKIATLTQEMLAAITLLLVQSQSDADRFMQLGMAKERLHVTGSLKFDLELPVDLALKGENLRSFLGKDRLIWIAASTHPGEDEMMLAAHKIIRQKFPQALLILVPRHPERFDHVADLIIQKNLTVVRRSHNEPCSENIAVYLSDTLGEMLLMFSACDVACVAGSFVAIGGHNVIEPAALRKPIITGPFLFNFEEITDLMIADKALIKVVSANDLAYAVRVFFEDAVYRHQTGENAYKLFEINRGSLQKQMNLIHSSMQRSGS